MNNLFKEINRKQTDAIKWDHQENNDNLPFWIADSDYNTAPVVIDELHNVAKMGAYGYNEVSDSFYKAVALWYHKRYNTYLNIDWIVASTGVILEMRVLLEIITKEMDEIILQTPVYHTFHHLINGLNRRIIENKLIKIDDTYQIDYENLELLFSEGHKVLILCSPHNPVGRVWSFEEIERIILLAKKYGAFVIVDEIHSDLNISNRKFISAAGFFNLYDQMVVCNAPSKAFNLAGLHTSYIIIPNAELRSKYQEQCHKEFLNTPSVFGYRATIKAYLDGDSWIDAQNEHIKNNYNYLKGYLNKELPQMIVTKLEGTYLVWLDLSFTKMTTGELLKKCNDYGITCSGGVNFCKDYESYLRFNIACPFEQLVEGLERLVKAFKK